MMSYRSRARYRYLTPWEPVEDWSAVPHTTCPRCGMEVRSRWYVDHIWIDHGIRAELVLR
jgi:hypothetical protein